MHNNFFNAEKNGTSIAGSSGTALRLFSTDTLTLIDSFLPTNRWHLLSNMSHSKFLIEYYWSRVFITCIVA